NILTGDIERLIRKIADSTGITNVPDAILNTATDEHEFYIKFYSLALGGFMESWLMGDINIPPEKTVEYFKKIISRNIIKQADTKQLNSDRAFPQRT
ncbi:MAG: TetR family transcriptional regulator C-terminal domain-containing protein, partial [Ruminococcus sp.]|nr:TetR family transcriptional regulator C-terminal domain-containing protein [Ruminococcus sp.]